MNFNIIVIIGLDNLASGFVKKGGLLSADLLSERYFVFFQANGNFFNCIMFVSLWNWIDGGSLLSGGWWHVE